MSRYVVKIGGHALDDLSPTSEILRALAQDVDSLRRDGHEVVIVHGGGPQIVALLEQVGVTSTFVDGLRVTSDDAMPYVAMALQSVNTALVSSLGQAGVKSVGISGVDGGLFVGDLGNGQLGRVATSLDVSPGFLQELWSIGAIPVLAPIARDRDGLLLNCNADVAAGALAAALGAQAVVLLSDVGQLRRVAEDEASGLDIVTKAEVDVMLANGAIRDGMRPKVRAALEALDAGAEQVIISNGKISHALSQALEGVSLTTKVVQ